MKKQITTSAGTFTYDDYSGKVTKRTGQHIGTVKEGVATFVRGGWNREMAEIVAALGSDNAQKPGRYVQDGYCGTASDHARGYDGIE